MKKILAIAVFFVFFSASVFAQTCAPGADCATFPPLVMTTAATDPVCDPLTHCLRQNGASMECIAKIPCQASPTGGVQDNCLCPGGTFNVALNVSSNPASKNLPDFFIENNLEGAGKIPVNYVCWAAGICFPIAENDVAIVNVSVADIKENETPSATVSFYSTNSGNVSIQYQFVLSKCSDLACSSTTSETLQADTFTVTVAGNSATQHTKQILLSGGRKFTLPSSQPAQGYKLDVLILGGVSATNTSADNDTGSARFAISRGMGDFPIPETNPLLVIVIAGIVSIIVFWKK